MSVSATDAALIARFPGYCRTCEGAGMVKSAGKREITLRSCPKCFEAGICPRCQTPMRFASYCGTCEWDIDENNPALPAMMQP